MDLRKAAICLGIALLTVLVYWQIGQHEFIAFDDNTYIFRNPRVTGGLTLGNVAWAFTTLTEGHWHPLTWLSHMADVELFGLNPAGHHFVGLSLHLANTFLILLLLRRMTGSFYRSALVAALFALHPLHVESVAWAAERKDLLSAFFGLLTLLAYCRYSTKPGIPRYLPVLFLFIAGLMSKPMLVTFPFLLLLFDFWPLGRLGFVDGKLVTRRDGIGMILLEKLPLVLCSAASSVITWHAQGVAGGTATIASFPVRAGNALVSYAAYLGKVFWPYDLAPLYPYPAEVPFMKILAACLLLVAITLLAVRFRSSAPCLLFGWLWYLGTLVPVIGLIKVGMQSMADRFTYIPSVGIFMMIVWGAGELVPSSRHWRVYAGVAAGAVLAILSYRTWQQAAYWRDTITLFEHSLSVTGSNYQAGAVLVAAKRDKRVNELLQAGYLDAVAGRGQEAADRFNEAISLDPDNPQVYSGIADIFRRIGNCPKAVDLYGQALELDPAFAPARSGIEQCRGVLNQGR